MKRKCRCLSDFVPFHYCCVLQMEVSLLVRNHKLQYDPPLEEIRMQHLTVHLQPFLALPLRMKGVSSLSERAGFFGAIAHAYPAATAKVGGLCTSRHTAC